MTESKVKGTEKREEVSIKNELFVKKVEDRVVRKEVRFGYFKIQGEINLVRINNTVEPRYNEHGLYIYIPNSSIWNFGFGP